MRWGVSAVCAAVWLAPLPAFAACTAITTPQQLSDIRDRLGRDYCLQNDLDMSGIANFVPIGDEATPFKGSFDGQGYTILNLKIRSGASGVGLFGAIQNGDVRDLRVAGVNVVSTADDALAGGVVGLFISGLVNRVSVAGAVGCNGDICRVGGIAGQIFDKAVIRSSSSSANVTGRNGGAAGGLTGQNNGKLTDVYATGQVVCRNNCAAGGLSGQAEAAILRAFASGPVTANKDGAAGGLVGVGHAPITDAYATGAVTVGRQDAAGLVAASGGRTDSVFAAGRVAFDPHGFAGGLMSVLLSSKAVTNSYWDKQTSTLVASAAGAPRTTTQLRLALPAGFGDAWSITEGVSYPFLTSGEIDFKSTLATVVRQQLIFTYLPISQLEQPEYENPAPNANRASLAAVYGMIARAAGITWGDDRLIDVKLDQYFWIDATQTAQWTGPATTYAAIGALKPIGPATTLDESNVVGALRAGRPVILRGSYKDGATTREHWMLATSFVNAGNGSVSRIVANDPWTRQQVMIHPSTKRVVSPAGFPLMNFRVDGYRVVQLQ